MSARTIALRKRRHSRVRNKVVGTAERPRLAVFRSARHIVAQVIDDGAGRTIAAASSHEPALKAAGASSGGNVAGAQAVGKLVAERAKAAGVSKVTFDRGGFSYHGRVAAVADAARESGLEL
ncbi:MAG: 50S ribosomal protein L18 [Acidimicrobiales bacterium]